MYLRKYRGNYRGVFAMLVVGASGLACAQGQDDTDYAKRADAFEQEAAQQSATVEECLAEFDACFAGAADPQAIVDCADVLKDCVGAGGPPGAGGSSSDDGGGTSEGGSSESGSSEGGSSESGDEPELPDDACGSDFQTCLTGGGDPTTCSEALHECIDAQLDGICEQIVQDCLDAGVPAQYCDPIAGSC